MKMFILPFSANFKAVLLIALTCIGAVVPSPSFGAAPVLGLWRFNEGSGTNALDSSGLNNNGTLAGQNGNLPAWVTGQSGFGGALRFTNDGTNHTYVNIPGSASLMVGQTATNPWTFTAWAYEDSGGTGSSVAAFGRFFVVDDGQAFQFESGSSTDEELYTWSRQTLAWQLGWGAGSAVAPLLDQWVHWAVVYDGTNLTIYRDGNQGTNAGVASMPVTAALGGYSGYTGSILIGSELDQTADRNWNGMLDDVAVFSGALTQDEIRTAMSGDFSAHLGGPAHLITQPQSQTLRAGADVSFTAAAQGVAPLTYQWYLDVTNLLAQATNSTLTLTNVQLAQSGSYSVVVSNVLASERSQPAVLIVYTNQTLLVGLWRFNEGAGTNTADSSGFGNDGTLLGENGNVPAWAAGQPGFGGALRFTNDGSDHAYVSIPGNSLLQIGQTATNPWSVTAWAYEDSAGTGASIATYGRFWVIDDGDAFQFESGATSDEQIYTWSRQTPAWQIPWGAGSAVAPLLDQWVHWAVVYDGTNINIYRNANQGTNGGYASTPVTAAVGYAAYTGSLLIGSELAQSGNRTWNGLLDDVAVLHVALSQPEIQTIMSGDFSAFVSRPSLGVNVSPAGLVLSWSAVLPGYQLQSSPALASPQWADVTTTPVLQGPALTVSLPPTARSQFFRLINH
jgi:hypothetical protein